METWREEYSWAHASWEVVSAGFEIVLLLPVLVFEPAMAPALLVGEAVRPFVKPATASLLKAGSELSYKILIFWDVRNFTDTLPGSTHITTASAGNRLSN